MWHCFETKHPITIGHNNGHYDKMVLMVNNGLNDKEVTDGVYL